MESQEASISRKKTQRVRRKPERSFNDFLLCAELAQMFLESLMFSLKMSGEGKTQSQ